MGGIFSRRPPTHIDKLNEDCLIAIFMLLPIAKRLEMEEVCVRWRKVSRRAWHKIRKLEIDCSYELSDGTIPSPDFIEKVLVRCGSYLENLRIDYISSTRLLRVIGKYCTNLKTINLDFQFNFDRHVKDAKALLQLRKLQSFTIRNTDQKFSMKCLVKLPKTIESIHFRFHSPENLNFSNIFGKFVAIDCMTFESCTLSNDLLEAVKSKQTITKLTLSSCKIEEGIYLILYLNNLEYLNLSHVDTVTDILLMWFSAQCKKLKYLNVSWCKQLTNRGIRELHCLDDLEELYMNYMESCVTDSSLGQLKGIKKLNCAGCTGIRDLGIKQMIRNSPELELLDVKGTSITIEILRFAIDVTKNRTNSVILKLIADLNRLNFFVEKEGRSPFLSIERFSKYS